MARLCKVAALSALAAGLAHTPMREPAAAPQPPQNTTRRTLLLAETIEPTTVPVTPVRYNPPKASRGEPRHPTDAIWACICRLESGCTNDGGANGHYGYFQWSDATWHSMGHTGHASDYPYETQFAESRRLQARSGWGQWSTSRKCGAA